MAVPPIKSSSSSIPSIDKDFERLVHSTRSVIDELKQIITTDFLYVKVNRTIYVNETLVRKKQIPSKMHEPKKNPYGNTTMSKKEEYQKKWTRLIKVKLNDLSKNIVLVQGFKTCEIYSLNNNGLLRIALENRHSNTFKYACKNIVKIMALEEQVRDLSGNEKNYYDGILLGIFFAVITSQSKHERQKKNSEVECKMMARNLSQIQREIELNEEVQNKLNEETTRFNTRQEKIDECNKNPILTEVQKKNLLNSQARLDAERKPVDDKLVQLQKELEKHQEDQNKLKSEIEDLHKLKENQTINDVRSLQLESVISRLREIEAFPGNSDTKTVLKNSMLVSLLAQKHTLNETAAQSCPRIEKWSGEHLNQIALYRNT